MKYKSQDIREAMALLASRNSREYYENVVILDVIKAFDLDLDHPLKAGALEALQDLGKAKIAKEVKPRQFSKAELATDEQFLEFYAVAKSFKGAMKALSELADIDPSTVSIVASNGYISLKRFNKFKPHFQEVLKLAERVQ